MSYKPDKLITKVLIVLDSIVGILPYLILHNKSIPYPLHLVEFLDTSFEFSH